MTEAMRQARPAVRTAAWLWVALAPALAPVPAETPADATPSGPTSRHEARDEVGDAALRAACDALLDAAVRRPYGWAWTEHPTGNGSGAGASAAARSNATVTVALDPTVTPAAGLVLYHAGRRLDEPRYREAAIAAARGVVAAQDTSGRIPARASFGRSARSADAPAAVPDRAPTRAGLGLLLTLLAEEALDEDEAARERFRSSARRAGYWLLKQQTKSAAWPVAHPPDAAPGKARRVLRLDTSEYRLSTIALLLAGDVLADDTLGFGGSRAAEHLLSMRAVDVKLGRGLWGTAYHLGGGFDGKTISDADSVDLLATREAMLTLLTHYLLTTDGTSLTALEQAAEALRALVKEKPLEQRFPGRRAVPASTAPAGVFTREPDPTTQPWTSQGASEVLALVEQLQQEGREAAIVAMASPMTLRQRLCAELCELPSTSRASAMAQSSETSGARRETRMLVLNAWGQLGLALDVAQR